MDDSEFMRAYLTRLLGQEHGFELVGIAPDGRQSLQVVAALRPDLILMDVNMPHLDGIAAARIIRQSGAQLGYAPVIIIVTSEDTKACRAQAEEAGANGFVPKSEHLRADLKLALDSLFSESEESFVANTIKSSHEASCA